LHIAKKKELFARADESFEDVVDRVVFLKDKLLLIDLYSSLKIDAVVEEFHQWLHI